MEKATTIAQIDRVIANGRPLEMDEINNFYYDADKAREKLSARRKLMNQIIGKTEVQQNGHFLFVGSTGSGKSTELHYLQKDLEKDFAVVSYSIFTELNPQSINYVELFIVQMEKLFSYAEEKQLYIDPDLLQRITDWTKTEEIQHGKDKHFSAQVSAGINSKFGIPYLQELFFKLKGVAKTTQSFKTTIKESIEPKLGDLIAFGNELIEDIRMKMQEQGKKDIIILVDDIEKIELKLAQDLFYDHTQQLVQLNISIVYVFPVWLYYHIRFKAVRNFFTDVVELPMIKVTEKDGTPYETGIDALRQMVYKRMDKDLFASPYILTYFINMSGGIIRDLFNMISDAAYYDKEMEHPVITEDGFTYAFQQLKKEYDNTIADYMDADGKVTHKADEYYKALVELVNNPKKAIDNSEIAMHLRQNLCVLSYNGEGWCDVHPVMKKILEARGKL